MVSLWTFEVTPDKGYEPPTAVADPDILFGGGRKVERRRREDRDAEGVGSNPQNRPKRGLNRQFLANGRNH